MFSDHARIIDEMPHKTFLGVAAGLVILCQLVAMALVADEQVAKAKMRDAQRASERTALARCSESRIGAALNSCIQQARAAANPSQGIDSRQSTQAVVGVSEIERGAMPAHQLQSNMPTSFAAR